MAKRYINYPFSIGKKVYHCIYDSLKVRLPLKLSVFNLQLKHASFVIELFLYDVKIYIFSYLYQIAQLGDDDDEPRFSSNTITSLD
jgi:hypothetical protein